MTTTQKATRFDRYDWYGYAGCTRFNDGSEPFIGAVVIDGEECTIVGDGEDIQVHLYPDYSEDAPDPTSWSLNSPPGLTSLMVEAIMNHVIEHCKSTADLQAAGFRQI